MTRDPTGGPETARGSMVEAFRTSLLQIAHRERMRKVRRMRTICALVGVGAGIVFAVFAYSRTSSFALAAFVLVFALVTIAGGLSAVLVGPEKARWAAYHVLLPVLVIGALASAYALWDQWWVAVGVALSVWFLVGGALAFAILPPPPPRGH